VVPHIGECRKSSSLLPPQYIRNVLFNPVQPGLSSLFVLDGMETSRALKLIDR
jgi:hypothetical protein